MSSLITTTTPLTAASSSSSSSSSSKLLISLFTYLHAQLNEHFTKTSSSSSSSSSSSDKAVTHQEVLDITHLLLQLVRILSTVGLPSARHNNISPFKNSISNGDDGNHYGDNKFGDDVFGGRSIESSEERNEGYEGVNNEIAAATVALKSLVRAIGVYLRHHRYLYPPTPISPFCFLVITSN